MADGFVKMNLGIERKQPILYLMNTYIVIIGE